MRKTMNRAFCLTSILVLAASSLCAQASRKPSARAARTERRSLLDPKSLNEKAPETYKAKFTTTRGDFVIEATRAWSPLGADRFYNLVKNRFYDGADFFRVLPGFVVQFGISPRPEVSKAWRAATIRDDPVKQSNLRGSVTFATGGPNTRTTQVFINLADNPRLDGMGFSPFGRVVEGMDIVDKLYSEYGEGAPQGRGPEQGRIESEGRAYLEKDFPRLDSIKTAVIVSPPREPFRSAGKTPAQEGDKP